MRGKDCLGSIGDRRLNPRRIEVKGGRVGLDENGSGADAAHGQHRRDVAVAGDDHIVTGTDVHLLKLELQRVESVADADTMAGAAIFRERRFERRDFGSTNVPASPGDPRDRRLDLGLKLEVGSPEIGEEDLAHLPMRRLNSSKSRIYSLSSNGASAMTRSTQSGVKSCISFQVIGPHS